MPDVIQIAIQATDLASKVIGGVGDSLDKLDKSADSADKKLKLFGLTTDQIGSKMSAAGKIATVGLTLPIAGLAVAATKAASDLNETANKIDTLFGSAANEIKKFSDTAATSLGQSKKQALDAAATFAVFGKSAGLAGQDLVAFSKQNVQLAADMASFFNTSPEEAITAIGAAFRGESEPIRRYGVLLDDASLKQQALRMGLIKTTTEALQPQQRVLAAQALIMQQTSAAAGDFAKTSGGLANQTRILEAQFQDMISTLGQSLLPIAIQVAGTANNILKAFNDLDQPTKDLIVGFGLMAAAAGPVLTIGGKLIGVFGTLGSVGVDVARGMISVGKTVGETAGYLKDAGVSVDNLKFAFQNLKGAGVILGAELGIIVAGLIAVAKYLQEVDAASKATNDSLIEMSHSGDVFKQAAAATEILTNGQERLKKTLDDVNEELKNSNRTYADYRSSIEATAKAAGYEIDAAGNLVQAFNTWQGVQYKVVQGNYALTDSEYAAYKAAHERGGIIDQGIKGLLALAQATEQVTNKQQLVTGTTKEQIEGYRQLAEARTRTGDAEKDYQIVVDKTLASIKAQNGVIADAYGLAITYTESQRKLADVQKELDDLNKTIADRGPARTTIIRNEKLTTEDLARAQAGLAVAQEDLATAQKKKGETDAEFALRIDTIKGKIADYGATLTGHIGIVGGATKAEQEQKKALEEQIAALQKSDEVTKAKGAFESLTKAFRDGVLTEEQYKERAAALNAITGLYTASALNQATAQETLMKSFADPRSEAWRSQLLINKEAIDGQVESTDKATDAVDKLNKKQAEAPPPRAVAKTEEVEIGGAKASASTESAQAHLDFINANEKAAKSAQAAIEKASEAQEKASREMKGTVDRIAKDKIVINVDSTKAKTEATKFVSSPEVKKVQEPIKTEVKADTAAAITQLQYLDTYGYMPLSTRYDELIRKAEYLNSLIGGTPLPGSGGGGGGTTRPPGTGPQAATGANFIVPSGYPNDSFPMRVTSGEHVRVTPSGKGSGNPPAITITQTFNGAQAQPEQYKAIMYEVITDVFDKAMRQ